MITTPKCRRCGGEDLNQLRPAYGATNTKKFEPTHHCNTCGWDFIWHHPKDVLIDQMRALLDKE